MKELEFKKLFSKLSHIKALSSDSKFEEIVQNLVLFVLFNSQNKSLKNDNDIKQAIIEYYGINIKTSLVQPAIDRLLASNKILKDTSNKELHLAELSKIDIENKNIYNNNIEQKVKEKWFKEIYDKNHLLDETDFEELWNLLNVYLSSIFEKNGVQTLNFLNPSIVKDDLDYRSNILILESSYETKNSKLPLELFKDSVNIFIQNADETRAKYISQLADASFTSFALLSDDETKKFLNGKFSEMKLFLDTNFIFGILDLHKNNEDSSAKEIIEELKKNNLPFKLLYHPETLNEFRRTFDSKSILLKGTKWTKDISKIALEIDQLSPIEELYHKQNINNEIDPSLFLEKYDQVDKILHTLGLIEYNPTFHSNDEKYEIENDVNEFQKFYESNKNRKIKSFQSFKHDITVLREVRSLNPKKTKFLDSKAFFLSSDYILGKFEKQYYKSDWEINYLVNPSVFLQLIRPFIENDYNSNKKFIDTFSISDFRSFDIDYSVTKSKALQILNDNYFDASYELKVQILRDQVLLSKLEKAESDYDEKIKLIDIYISYENSKLVEENIQIKKKLEESKHEQKNISDKKLKAEAHIKEIKTDNELKDIEKSQLVLELESIKKDLEFEKKNRLYRENSDLWERSKNSYLDQQKKDLITNFKTNSKYCIRPIITLFSTIVILPLYLKFFDKILDYIATYKLGDYNDHIVPIVIFILLAGIAFYEIIGRTYLTDKEKVKNGLLWIIAFNEKRKSILINKNLLEIEKNYITAKPKPEL